MTFLAIPIGVVIAGLVFQVITMWLAEQRRRVARLVDVDGLNTVRRLYGLLCHIRGEMQGGKWRPAEEVTPV